jgi:hypothetical protein
LVSVGREHHRQNFRSAVTIEQARIIAANECVLRAIKRKNCCGFARVSHGQADTMQELLRVFNLQADLLLARMTSGDPKTADLPSYGFMKFRICRKVAKKPRSMIESISTNEATTISAPPTMSVSAYGSMKLARDRD